MIRILLEVYVVDELGDGVRHLGDGRINEDHRRAHANMTVEVRVQTLTELL